MNNKLSIRHKGFTLIELLIVIVVIGILSAMMMFSSTEAASSAKASNIISNLRQLKTATLAWYMDNLDRVNPTGGKKDGNNIYQITTNGTQQNLKDFLKDGGNKEITRYLSNGSTITLTNKSVEDSGIKEGDYVLTDVKYKNWYICYKVGSDKRLKEKLASRTKSVGLEWKQKIGNDDNIATKPYNQNTELVCLLVLSLE